MIYQRIGINTQTTTLHEVSIHAMSYRGALWLVFGKCLRETSFYLFKMPRKICNIMSVFKYSGRYFSRSLLENRTISHQSTKKTINISDSNNDFFDKVINK